MTKLEFASAWRQFQAILKAHAEYRNACIDEKAARARVTPEMFLGEDKENTPQWQAWTRAWQVRDVALRNMLDGLEALENSDVGELLREDFGPYAVNVDPDDKPLPGSHGVLVARDGPTPDPEPAPAVRSDNEHPEQASPEKRIIHGSRQEPGVGSGGGEEAAPKTD